MLDIVVPYLKLSRNQLETVLLPSDPAKQKQARYLHRTLTMLWRRYEHMPLLQRDALSQIDALLDELIEELRQFPATMIVIPQLTQHIRQAPDYARAEPLLQQAVRFLQRSPNERSRLLLQRLADIALQVQEEFQRDVAAHALKPATEGKAPAPLNDEQVGRLENFLRSQFPTDDLLRIGNMTQIVGGGSKKTVIMSLANTRTLPAEIVLRMDSGGGVVASKVVDEFNLVMHLSQAGVAVPKPLALESTGTVLGAPFIIVTRVAGHNIGDWEEVTEPSETFAVDLAHTLARLHGLSPDVPMVWLPGAGIATSERIRGEMRVFEDSWRSHGEASIAMELAYKWLQDHLQFADGQRSVIHCDVGCHNMLGDAGRLTALLDWETAVVGNPAQDLAYVQHTVVQMMPWERFLDAYRAAGGTVPPDEQMDFYRLWRNVFTMHYEYMARAFFFSGASSDLIIGYSSQHVFQYCNLALHRSISELLRRYP